MVVTTRTIGRMLIVISVPTPMPDVLSSRHSGSWREYEPRTHVNKQSRSLKSGQGGVLDMFERILDRINRGETFQGMTIRYCAYALGVMGKVSRKAGWILRDLY
jgi:hypothetical protein